MNRCMITMLVVACVTVSAATIVGARTSSRARSGHKHASARSVSRAPAVVPSATHVAASNCATPGMVIGIDPQTGATTMPTPEQMARLRAATSSAIPAPVHHPNGSISLDCRGWLREHFVVTPGADGRPVPFCVDGREQALRVMQLAPRNLPGQEER